MENREGGNVKKRTKIILIVLAVLLVTGTAWIAYRIHVYREDLKPKYCELTDKERKFLNAFRNYNANDMERFKEGMLYDSEIMQLEWLRRLYADLEERYPGYRFYISDKNVPGLMGRVGHSEYYTEEETTGHKFTTYVYLSDRDYAYEEDNFYRYFVEEEYAEYVGELLKAKGVKGIAKTHGVMQKVMGKECDSTITVEEIVNKYIEEISPTVWIFLTMKGRTEGECMEYAEEVQEKLEEINLEGSYCIYCCDMTEEEIVSSAHEERVYTYIHICRSWEWRKEEEE